MNIETNIESGIESGEIDRLVNRELELEHLSSSIGVSRYHKDRPAPWREDKGSQKEEADLAPGRELVRRAIEPFAAAIRELVDRVASGRGGRGRPTLAVKYLREFDPETVAFIAARRIINAGAQQEGLTSTAVAVANLLEDHLRFEEFAEKEPGLYKHTLRKLEKTTHAGHRRGVLNHALKLTSVKGLEWSTQEKTLVGLKLIELCIETTKLVQVHTERRGKRIKDRLRFTESTAKWLENQHARCALFSPVYLPMVVPPVDWTNPIDGGYLDKNKLRFPMVKTNRKDTLDELFHVDMPQVYDAVNLLQQTPWRINAGVRAVASEAWERGMAVGGLPNREEEPVPNRPADIPKGVPVKDLPEGQRVRIQEWAKRATVVYDRNARLVGKRYTVLQQLWVAETFAADGAIYFPYTLDFRGRIYAVPPLVNPQADDLGRSLIEFAEGKPLGEDGAFWLAVHVANTYGFDKAPLADRVRWVLDNEELIHESAINPLDGSQAWCEADSPWSFLAACQEWVGYRIAGKEFVSHLPVQVDGTCSGLQHFSAMLRDEVGGAAVNLTPTPAGAPKADIYGLVATKVEDAVQAGDTPELVSWKGKVTRSAVKRPTMTFAYSATERGTREHIEQYLRDEDPEGDHLEGVPYFEGSRALAPAVRKAIRSTVVAAAEAMDWLQETAKAASRQGLPLRWTTPAGFPVLQDARKLTEKRVKANFSGVQKKIVLRVETGNVDGRRQSQGIAPNYVHSLDACHLMWTVLGSHHEGVDSFSMIHDSFGAHAGSVSIMAAELREAFVSLYGEGADRLGDFQREVREQVPPGTELPARPATGSLRVEAVRDSEFFFC